MMSRAKMVFMENIALNCAGPAFETESAITGEGSDKYFLRNYSICSSGPIVKDKLVDPYPDALRMLIELLEAEKLSRKNKTLIVNLFIEHYSRETGLSKSGYGKIQKTLAAAGSGASVASFLSMFFS